ncbi:MAG: SDR family oxidoreductase [Proteobacteria bacterium]|nr:SDR family oxidoreductase [Pseudomonadota bacterium]
MKEFKDKLAVITGAGTGMGRELAIKLAAAGCGVAVCDVLMDNLAETVEAARKAAPDGTPVTAHECDVSDESQVLAFRRAVRERHGAETINLLFNNAGVGGGGSFILDPREEWDRVFGIDWFGVYYCTRAFMPMLLSADEGHIINISSINGFWACLGPNIEHTAYSAAKFAVKGFTEALLVDLKLNAPHIKVSLVMPGHIGTSISFNSPRVLGYPEVEEMTAEDLNRIRGRIARRGIPTDGITDEALKSFLQQMRSDFQNNAPVSAAEAADAILDGVRRDQWRILVGQDAHDLDRLVREFPEEAYDDSMIQRIQAAAEARGK